MGERLERQLLVCQEFQHFQLWQNNRKRDSNYQQSFPSCPACEQTVILVSPSPSLQTQNLIDSMEASEIEIKNRIPVHWGFELGNVPRGKPQMKYFGLQETEFRGVALVFEGPSLLIWNIINQQGCTGNIKYI